MDQTVNCIYFPFQKNQEIMENSYGRYEAWDCFSNIAPSPSTPSYLMYEDFFPTLLLLGAIQGIRAVCFFHFVSPFSSPFSRAPRLEVGAVC